MDTHQKERKLGVPDLYGQMASADATLVQVPPGTEGFVNPVENPMPELGQSLQGTGAEDFAGHQTPVTTNTQSESIQFPNPDIIKQVASVSSPTLSSGSKNIGGPHDTAWARAMWEQRLEKRKQRQGGLKSAA